MGTHQNFVHGDRVVSVQNELLSRQGHCFLKFAGNEHGHGSQQLQLRLGQSLQAQHTVHVVHSQRKHLLFAALFLAHLDGRRDVG